MEKMYNNIIQLKKGRTHVTRRDKFVYTITLYYYGYDIIMCLYVIKY